MRARRNAWSSRGQRRPRLTARSRPGEWRWASSRCSTWGESTWESMCIEPTPTAIRRIRLIIRRMSRSTPRGRLGQKSGKGYYKYLPGERTRYEDPEAIDILESAARRLDIPQRTHSAEEIVERCLYPLINEGIRILEEGIALRAADVDVVWCAGYGFPRYRGGPMFHADTIGLKTVRDGMLKYRDLFGPMHWQPSPLLERLADEGRSLADWGRGAPRVVGGERR